ncbi:MAG: helix-turn-helix transcriptional regulator [Thermomicrobiales bacterium]
MPASVPSCPPGPTASASPIPDPMTPQPAWPAASPWVGREAELATIHRLLVDQGVRLLTLTGTAGVGKTRLAHEAVASFTRDNDPFDTIVVVPLAAVVDSETVVAEIAKAMGLRDGGGIPLPDSIRLACGDRRTLLVLDTFEHVTAAREDLTGLLAACPDLTMLVTSRTPLHVYGEQQVTVEPFPEAVAVVRESGSGEIPDPLPDAVALFLEHLRLADPGFVLTLDAYARIAAICQRLDGIPLAIELAASRTRELGLSQLQDRLDRRLHALQRDSPDVPMRQRSMNGAIAWSYDLLPPEDRTLLRRVSIFPGGFSVAAVEAVSDDHSSRPALASLSSLVDSSLIRPVTDAAGEDRFACFEAVREFAREQLERQGESQAAHRRMAETLIAFGREIEPNLYRGRDLPTQLSRIDAELPNLRAAMTWADTHDPALLVALSAPLGQYWLRRSMLTEGRSWAERILAHGDDLSPSQRLRALVDRSRMMTYQADPGVSAVHAEATALARAIGDAERELDILASRIVATMIRGDYADVRGLLAEAQRIERANPVPVRLNAGRPQVLRILGAVAIMEEGDLDTATALVRESLIIARVEQDEAVAMIASRVLGGIQSSQGYHAEAFGHFQQALRAYFRVGERWTSAVATLEIAWEVIEVRPALSARLFGIADHLMASIGLGPIGNRDSPPRRWRHLKGIAIEPGVWDEAYQAGFAEPLAQAVESVLVLEYPGASGRRSPQANAPSVDPAPLTALSRREREVLALIIEGRTDRDIATQLGIRYRTTTTYVASIFAKLHVTSRAGAAAMAVRYGLDRPEA